MSRFDNSTSQVDDDTQVIEGEMADGHAIMAISKAEIDMQISTAKRYPRSLAISKRKMIEMATIDIETAKSCGYALRRTGQDGKPTFIEGPSIRMAEIAISCWGNVRYGAKIIDETDRFIVAQGVCHDLETNVYSSIEVRRRITNRQGKKYGDDMVGVTSNAACSIAARNAVFKVIPRAIIDQAYGAAMQTASGDQKTFGQRRGAALGAFQKIGVTLEQVMWVLGKQEGSGIDDIDTTDLRRLHGLLTSIQDGESTVDKIFSMNAGDGPAETSKTAALNERMKQTESPKQTAAPAETAPSAPSPETAPEVSEPAQTTPESKPEPTPIKEPSSFLSHAELIEHLNGAAMDLGVSETDMRTWLSASIGAAATDVSKQNKMTPKSRREVWVEFVGAHGGAAVKG